ncbi:hypothetical protein FOZ63_010283, partial [Perkinsus olseni]
DILDDVDLILSLEEAKKTSDEVKEKVVVAQDTEARINETSENYRPSANRGALLFFLLMDLCKVHGFYKYSLDAFVQVVTRAVDSVSLRKPKVDPASLKAEVEEAKEEGEPGAAEDGMDDDDDDDDDEPDAVVAEEEVAEEEEEVIELTGKDLLHRVELLMQVITIFTFNYTRRGLFDKHKLIVASLLCLRILVRNQVITQSEVDILIRAPPDPAAPPMPSQMKSWLTEFIWQQLKTVETIPAFKSSSSGALTQNIEQDSLGWKR